MRRLRIAAVVAIAGALAFWLLLPSGEDGGTPARVAAFEGRSAAGGGPGAGPGGEAGRVVGPGRSVGDASTQAVDPLAARGDARDGDRAIAEAGLPGVGSAPRLPLPPGRSSPSESAAELPEVEVADTESEEPSDPLEPSFADLEAEAAQIAEELGLVTEAELAHWVDRELRKLPADQREAARDRVSRQILAKEAVLAALARDKLGPGAPLATELEYRNGGRPFLVSEGPRYQEQLTWAVGFFQR